MHGAGQIETVQTAGLDAEGGFRVAFMHQSAAASGAEIAVERAARERDAGVNPDGARVGGRDGEGWEYGRQAEGG